MTTPARVPPDLHAWAGRNLEVAADASVSEARTAFLRKLPDSQWVPPPALEESQQYWSRPEMVPALLEQAIPDEEFRLRGQVDEFAEQFFELVPAQRRERYERLVAECAWSATLSGRVQSLAAGLTLRRRPWENAPETEREIVEQMCRLFTLAPADRARRRWEMLQELEAAPESGQGRSADWRKIIRSVRERHPEVASLVPALLQELAAGQTPKRWSSGRLPQAAPVTAPAPSGNSGGNPWWIAPIALVLLSVVRMMCSQTNHTPAPQFQPPQFQPPQFQPPQFQQDDIMKKFREEIRANPKKFGEGAKGLFGDDPPDNAFKPKKPPKFDFPDPEKRP